VDRRGTREHAGGKVVELRPGARPADDSAPDVLTALFEAQRDRLVLFFRARLGSASEAQDAAQAVFLRMWERRDSLRDENLKALMFVTARNLATDMLRARGRGRPEAEEGALDRVEDDAPSAERALAARQELGLVAKLVRELPEKCQTAFLRYKFDGAEYGQIARELRITESMVRKYVLRAVAHCAARYQQMDGWG